MCSYFHIGTLLTRKKSMIVEENKAPFVRVELVIPILIISTKVLEAVVCLCPGCATLLIAQ